MFDEVIENLKDRLLANQEEMDTLLALAASEKRDLTDEELDKAEVLRVEAKQIDKQLKVREEANAQREKISQSMGRLSDPNEIDDGIDRGENNFKNEIIKPKPKVIRVITRENESRNWGWRSGGEFAQAVWKGSRPGAVLDPRLVMNAPSTVSTEGNGPDGGFAVPPDFRTDIMQKVIGEGSLAARTDQLQTTGNTIVFPKDETTPWQTSGGVLAYWESEYGQITQSKIALEGEMLRLNKLTALVPVTEELLEDAVSLDSYLRRKIPQKFEAKINTAMLTGTGAGQPLGILNAGCLVSVGKESGQSADTIVAENIINMWARMYGPCRERAVWIYNQDIEPQLMTMKLEGSAGGIFPLYMPAGGLADSPYGRIMGRPAFPMGACKSLGDQGDIFLADWSQYMTVTKVGGLRSDVSIHLWFDYDVTAFRFVMRFAGQPWWRAAITPEVSTSTTLGCFVTLDERA